MQRILIIVFLNLYFIQSFASYPIDDFEDGDKNNIAGSLWTQYTDGFSILNFDPKISPGVNGSLYCAKINIVGKSGAQYQYGGIVSNLNSNGSKVDLSEYEGIRFWAKGSGSLGIQIPIVATNATYNHYESEVNTNSEWTLFQVKFKSFAQTWGPAQTFDLATVLGVQFNISTTVGDTATYYIDNIEFFKSSEYVYPSDIVSPCPKVNQVGYLPSASKIFSITSPYANPGDAFSIIAIPGNVIAYSGNLSTVIINDTLSTGEKILIGDFTSFSSEGYYYVQVDTLRSETFQIKNQIYYPLFCETLRTFYINRCGLTLDDPHTGIHHAACHLGDTLIRGSSENRDFTGAWHNAGDFGKWTNLNAINVSYMMWTYYLNSSSFQNLEINIPESTNNISDLLDESKWGLDWMLKMQNPDGSVFHKVDTEPYFAAGKRPDQDTLQRYASFQKASDQNPSTIDAASFVAAMVQAYHIFLPVDSLYAVQCKNAALKTWNWMKTATHSAQDDPYYLDSDYSQELLWAKSEMYCLTKDSLLLNDLIQIITSQTLDNISWSTPQALGYLSIYTDPSSDQSLKAAVADAIQHRADNELLKSDKSGYGVAMAPAEYYWESNETVLHKANMFVLAYIMTQESKYLEYALNQLNYILGRNSLNLSFVSGFGNKSVLHPYHWANLSEGIALPGWIAGGANQYSTGVDAILLARQNMDLPPAKCFVDDKSYGCNEGETTEAAALIFLSGFFYDQNLVLTDVKPNVFEAEEKFLQVETVYFSADQVNVRLSLRKPAEVEVCLYQLNGTIVSNKYIKSNGGNINYQERMEKNPSGLYLIRINAIGDSWTETVTVKRIKE